MLRRQILERYLSENFDIDMEDIDVDNCSFLKCPDFIPCNECKYYGFWNKESDIVEVDP